MNTALMPDIVMGRRKMEEIVDATAALAVSELRYRRLFESAKDGILILDAGTGMIVDVNPFLVELLGFSREAFFGKEVWELGFFKDIVANHANFTELQQREYIRYEDKPLQAADGRRVDVEFVSNVYQVNHHKVIQCNIRDITERKRAAKERDKILLWQQGINQVQQSLLAPAALEDKLRNITESVVRIFGADFCRIWLIRPGDLCGRGCIHAGVKEGPHVCHDRARCLHLLASSGRYIHTDGKAHGRVPFGAYKIGRVASGEDHKFLTNDAPNDPRVHNHEWACELGLVSFAGYQLRIPDGETLGVLALFARHPILPVEDALLDGLSNALSQVIQQAKAEESNAQLENELRQAQKMEAVGRLAGGVAHDFNNLLMAIMGYVELCRTKIEPDHPIVEWLDEIMSDAKRSAEITRQLLAFARKQIIVPKVLDLNDAVTGMLKLLRRLIGEDINLSWSPGADLQQIKIDPSQVDQILANLCVNARDAIAGVGKIILETGNVTIDADYCAGHVDAIPGKYVCLAVSDDGCGMDPGTLAQIFEPFFTTKGVGKGTGLGLATVYGIVKQNNGFIYPDSEPGKGTTFKIYLPQVAAEAVATNVDGKTEEPKGRGETIMLVEDEKSMRVVCTLFLEALGYKVLVAETPEEAMKIAGLYQDDIHLLLTDVVMPGMDGRQLAERLGSVKTGLKILFMSGYTADVMAQRGVLEHGMALIVKPFMRKDLAHKVREVLDGK